MGTTLLVFGVIGMVIAGIVAAGLIGGAIAARNLDERLAAERCAWSRRSTGSTPRWPRRSRRSTTPARRWARRARPSASASGVLSRLPRRPGPQHVAQLLDPRLPAACERGGAVRRPRGPGPRVPGEGAGAGRQPRDQLRRHDRARVGGRRAARRARGAHRSRRLVRGDGRRRGAARRRDPAARPAGGVARGRRRGVRVVRPEAPPARVERRRGAPRAGPRGTLPPAVRLRGRAAGCEGRGRQPVALEGGQHHLVHEPRGRVAVGDVEAGGGERGEPARGRDRPRAIASARASVVVEDRPGHVGAGSRSRSRARRRRRPGPARRTGIGRPSSANSKITLE